MSFSFLHSHCHQHTSSWTKWGLLTCCKEETYRSWGNCGVSQRMLERIYYRIWLVLGDLERVQGSRALLRVGCCQEWGNSMIEILLEGRRNEMRLKLWLVKKQQSPVLARIGNVWSFLWLGHCSRFIHVQTWLQRGLVFCLDPSWPQSSFVWRWCLWNCLCSTGEHHCLAVSASSWQHHSIADAARPALAVRGSSFLEPYLSSVVPNRFDTRDRFCGRHFSTDRSGGGDMKVQAVMWAMGSGRWSFAHLPAVHLLLCSRGLGTPVLADYVFL